MQDAVVRVGESVTIRAQFTNRAGETVAPLNPPSWKVGDPDKATIEPADDGLTVTVTATAEGATAVGVSADVDLGDGVVSFSDLVRVKVRPEGASDPTGLYITRP